MKRLRRWLKIVLGTVAAAYLTMVVLLMFFEESMIFFPSPYPEGNWKVLYDPLRRREISGG